MRRCDSAKLVGVVWAGIPSSGHREGTALAALEDLKAGASVRGLTPDGVAKVVQVEWFGDQAIKVTFEDASGAVRNRLV